MPGRGAGRVAIVSALPAASASSGLNRGGRYLVVRRRSNTMFCVCVTMADPPDLSPRTEVTRALDKASLRRSGESLLPEM
jgi:hypothetical protein